MLIVSKKQILPFGIEFLNQFKLPLPVPLFYSFLSHYSAIDVIKSLIMDQYVNTVFFGETIDQSALMLPYSFVQIVGHSNIECPISLTCKNVHEVLLHGFRFWIPAFAGMTSSIIYLDRVLMLSLCINAIGAH